MNGHIFKKQKPEQEDVKAMVLFPAMKPRWTKEKYLFDTVPTVLLFYSNTLKIHITIG